MAPTLFHYEVVNALYRLRLAGKFDRDAARGALRAALDVPFRLHGEEDLHPLALELAGRLALPTTYDAHYEVRAGISPSPIPGAEVAQDSPLTERSP